VESVRIVLVVEDEVSRAVMERLMLESGRQFVLALPPRVCRGAGNIFRDLPRYRNACKAVPHIILVDLDKATCAPGLRNEWGLGTVPPALLFRIAVREVEASLLADRQGFSEYLLVPQSKIPTNPESLADPKQVLVNLARRSRSRRLADKLVPALGSRMPMGPLYNEVLERYVRDHWDVARAAKEAPSLATTLRRLREFVQT
jgi:hypothetical protein